jgi:hypothetical protein
MSPAAAVDNSSFADSPLSSPGVSAGMCQRSLARSRELLRESLLSRELLRDPFLFFFDVLASNVCDAD